MSWWFSPSSGRRLTFAGCFLALSHLPVPWRRRKRSGGEFGGSWWEYRFFPYFFWLYLHMSRWWKMQHLRFKITCMLCQLPTRTGGGLFVGAGSIQFFSLLLYILAKSPLPPPSSSILPRNNAVMTGNITTLRYLVDEVGVKTLNADCKGYTPLQMAVVWGQLFVCMFAVWWWQVDSKTWAKDVGTTRLCSVYETFIHTSMFGG